MSPNGDNSKPPTLDWPTLLIPGRGTFRVRFGFRAFYEVLERFGLDEATLGQRLQSLFPHRENGALVPGRPVDRLFLLDLLEICLRAELTITREELCDAFDRADTGVLETWIGIATAIGQAYAKIMQPTQPRLQPPAAQQELPTAPVN